jgi:Cys-tRNA(Pro)/Cys-tRNA(Cys) deacylase
MSQRSKNNVIRLLNASKIDFEIFFLPGEKYSAAETAQFLNLDACQVYKTIVINRTRPGKPILAVVPGPDEVDIKKLARLVKEKKLKPATQKEAEAITGLLSGGISPLALINKGFQVVIDSTAVERSPIHISGGERGSNIKINTRDLIQLTGATTGDIRTL